MKRIVGLLLCLSLLTGTVVFAEPTSITTATEYELWTQSPTVTCGLTDDELLIYKALDQNLVDLYPLTVVGPNYYFAICTYKVRDGGWSGKTDTCDFYVYTLYATEDGFIILSKARHNNEYYWDRGFCFADISGKTNKTYYTNNGSERPCYIINPKGKYTNTNYTEYDDYWIITDKGNVYSMCENAEDGTEGYPFIKSGILYRGQERYRQSSSYPYYYLSDGITKASNYTPIFFKNGSITYGTAAKVAVTDLTVANGYDLYKEGFDSNVVLPEYKQISGSNNLYFTAVPVRTYDSASSKYYYYCKVDIYRSDGNYMNFVRTQIIPTTSTSSAAYTCYALTGLNESYYTNKGYQVPSVLVGSYCVILRDGTIGKISLDTTKYSSYWYVGTYNNKLAIIRSRTNGSTNYHVNEETGSSCYWQMINEISFNASGTMSMTNDLELPIKSSANPGQNGYFSSYSTWNGPNFTTLGTASVKGWWGRGLTNVFPDGRYVEPSWMSMGGGLYELWYNIYNTDGTRRATGPTGYSGNFGSSFDTYDLVAYAFNNSKFIVGLAPIGRSFMKEYYRVAVVEESETGEISSKTELGKKNITPPSNADTEVVQPSIDFGENDLPIGYNIKDNVIDSGKLELDLREQVNTIRLNDIVIIATDTYQSGIQNTGVTLDYYSTYDYALGSSYVRFYSNGQNFQWYCYNPEKLQSGTYNKTFYIGDKQICVTIKVVQPPQNNGSTTVVF